MTNKWAHLLLALRTPTAMAEFDPDVWDLVVRQGASASLLGRLGALARETGIEEKVPRAVRHHMQAVMTLAEQQQRAVRWELVNLSETLSELQGPVVLLKGAAYAAASLAPGPGRLFSDIDLLVPKSQIHIAESALLLGGWNSSHHDSYDQRYYRDWMHELPPMTHIRRQTVLDLHHNILPETARIRTYPERILAQAKPLADFPRFGIPCPADQVLHSATHLFHEGEWEHGLRDLVDLDALLRAYGHESDFWTSLIQRANELKLGRPLFYGLRYCQKLILTPVPADVSHRCPQRPGVAGALAMDCLFLPAFSTAHHSCRHWFAGVAVFILYVRSHWLRMPFHLLLPHIVRKSWKHRVEALFKREPLERSETP